MTGPGRFVSDLRSAFRAIRHTPWVSAVVVLSVGIGIGANTVVFSWLESFTLRPMPGVERANEFHFVEPISGSGGHPGSSWVEYQDLASRLDMFEGLLAFRMSPLNLGEAGRTERVFGQFVSGNYFTLLGLSPVAGQLLRPAGTHAVRAAARVADLAHRMGGTSGLYERSRLERHFRDAQTVRHHGFLSESRLETVGHVYLGLEPEFGFVAF
jgi:hypothetical protein